LPRANGVAIYTPKPFTGAQAFRWAAKRISGLYQRSPAGSTYREQAEGRRRAAGRGTVSASCLDVVLPELGFRVDSPQEGTPMGGGKNVDVRVDCASPGHLFAQYQSTEREFLLLEVRPGSKSVLSNCYFPAYEAGREHTLLPLGALARVIVSPPHIKKLSPGKQPPGGYFLTVGSRV